ncbi:hypothetical protein PAMA_002412 [Pampus argenteus]
MASSKYKSHHKKKKTPESRMSVGYLRKENANLKKTLLELSRQHSEHNKLLERFLSLETVRLEGSQQSTDKDEKISLSSEQLSKNEGNLMDVVSTRSKTKISSYSREMEEIKNKLVSVSTRCQYLENKVAEKKDSASDEQLSSSDVTEIQNHLRDALEKNKQWLEYDQQREAYVKAVLGRMLWLEKQLNDANQARSQQHNKDHSDEKDKLSQMQEHYERLLQKAKDQREVLIEQLDMTQQDLIRTQNWCKERERQVYELKQQLQTHHRGTGDKEQQLSDETKDFLNRLDKESLFYEFMANRYHADKKKIADLERQIRISTQDLEDERQNCSYLKKQMVRVLKSLQKSKDHVTKQSKKDQQDHVIEVINPPHQTSSPHSSLLNDSFLECPGCQAEYPASHYRDLMEHLEICLH